MFCANFLPHPCPITLPIFEKHAKPCRPMQSFVCPTLVSPYRVITPLYRHGIVDIYRHYRSMIFTVLICFQLIRKRKSGYKMVDFLVRFAALISFLGLVTGYGANNFSHQLVEVVMIVIWLLTDMHNLKNLATKIKAKLADAGDKFLD